MKQVAEALHNVAAKLGVGGRQFYPQWPLSGV